MGRKEFVSWLQEHFTGHSRDQIELALDRYVEANPAVGDTFYQNQLADVAAFLNISDREPGPQADPFKPGATVSAILSMDLERMISPEIEDVRTELFGSPAPPWTEDEYAKAIRWLRREAGNRRRPTPEQMTRFEGLREDFRRLGSEMAEIWDIEPPRLNLQFCHLSYMRPEDGQLGALCPCADSILGDVARRIENLHKITGFGRADLTSHILIGSALYRDSVEVMTTNSVARLAGRTIRQKEVRVLFRGPAVSDQLMRRLMAAIRSQWGAERTKQPTERDRGLLAAMRACGGDPADRKRVMRGEKIRFWGQVAELLGGYKDWRGPHKRYQRLRKKLDQL